MPDATNTRASVESDGELWACRLTDMPSVEWMLCTPCRIYLQLAGCFKSGHVPAWTVTVDMPNYCERCEERCWSPEEFDAVATQEESHALISHMLNRRRERQTRDPIDYTNRARRPGLPPH